MFSSKSVTSLIVLAGATFLCTAASAQTSVLVKDLPPMTITAPGMSYASGNGTIELRVPTSGFLLCANPLAPNQSPQFTAITLTPEYGGWALPTAKDVNSFTYGAGGNQLRINNTGLGGTSSLVCHAASAQGWTMSPFQGGLFYDAFELALPANPYGTTENVVASVTGLTSSGTYAPRMLTQTYTNGGMWVYMYMFEVYGQNRINSTNPNVNMRVRDAYDATRLGNVAWSCELDQLPSGNLDLRTLCPNAPVTTGNIEFSYYLDSAPKRRFIIVHRVVQGTQPLGSAPLAGAAVFVDPRAPKADLFVGDNVVFSVPPQ